MRTGNFDWDLLLRVFFSLNRTPHQDGSNFPAFKYLRRGVCTFLPNSVDREAERRQLVQRRQEAQLKLATKKGRSSVDSFVFRVAVRVRNHLSGRWDTRGLVFEERNSGTSYPPASFMIMFSDGAEVVHHKVI